MKQPNNTFNLDNMLVFIAVFFSSMLGAKIFGVSLNKLALIPLEIYLLVRLFRNGLRASVNRFQWNLILWYIAMIFSSIIGLFYSFHLPGTTNKLLLNILQGGLIYIPLILGIREMPRGMLLFSNAIIITAKMNGVLAILQFFFWYLIKFDLNAFIFNTVLGGVLGNEWTVWNYEAGSLAIRATGLNHDAAFFAIIMIFGFCLCDSKLWRLLFWGATLLSMSRGGVITITFIFLLQQIKKMQRMKVKGRTVMISVLSTILMAGTVYCLYKNIPSVRYQVEYFFWRLTSISFSGNSDSGTYRHLMYIPASLIAWLDLPWIYKFFGIGARVSGAGLLNSVNASGLLTYTSGMRTTAWSIECDFAELLLGTGIIGILAYYYNLVSLFYKSKKNGSLKLTVLALATFGVMYNSNMNTIVNLFLIFATAHIKNNKILYKVG